MAEPAIGEVIDGRYEIEAPIGRGGMGTVWRARHVFTNVRVALKLLIDEYDAIAFERFLAEARAASTIGHPAIVVVNDANRVNNQLYLVMELLAGKPLRVAIATGAVSSGDQIRRIGLEILDALGAAHARGIIHRDLKPENIFLVAPGSTVKLLDFGIAKVLGGVAGRSTHSSGVLGTVEYMAPEQLADASAVDGRADLWALGVILYEMVAGIRPFGGATPGEKLHALLHDEPMPIGEVIQVPAQITAFFQIALAKDRDRRFATAAAMSQALRSLAFTGGAAPSAAASPTLGDMPDPALGIGAGWQRPSGNLPGPTLGSGAAWQKPAPTSTSSSGDPYGFDNERQRVAPVARPEDRNRATSTMPPTSDPYGIGTPPSTPPNAYGKPSAIPPADAYGHDNERGKPPTIPSPQASMPLATPRTTEPRRGRTLAFAFAGVALIGVGVGVALFASRSSAPSPDAAVHSEVTVDAVVRVDVPAADAAIAPMTLRTGSCQKLCKEHATCGLALPNCLTECGATPVFQSCLVGAQNCDERAACHWNKICGRPVRSGGEDCMYAMQCWGTNFSQPVTLQCTQCYDQLAPKAATLLAQFSICYQTVTDEMARFQNDPKKYSDEYQKAYTARCQPLGLTCASQKL